MKSAKKTPVSKPVVRKKKQHGTSIKAFQGDHMTMLAFDIDESLNTPDFVGFTIQYETPSGKKFYILNKINFTGVDKLIDSIDAPIQKFRWLHVPGGIHQTLNDTEYGTYTYYTTPRYYDSSSKALKPIDGSLTAQINIPVGEFKHQLLELAFTRSYVNSQAYKYRFAGNAKIVPDGNWDFDTSRQFTSNNGIDYSYEDLYRYLGFTARKKILDLLKEAVGDTSITIEMFTYDFNEPVVADLCLTLAKQGRIRIISDDYISKTKNKLTGKVTEAGHGLDDADETLFFTMFNKVKTGKADIVRHHFARFQHNKQIIFSKNWKNPYKVLSGATNFSITGICVNANHVVVFNSNEVAKKYSEVFNAVWTDSGAKAFKSSLLSTKPFTLSTSDTKLSVTYSPHGKDDATKLLADISTIIKEAKQSVLFSVMQISGSGGDVMPALKTVQNNTKVFSYGITDAVEKDIVKLYKPGAKTGILVNAKAIATILPPPFNKEDTFNAHKIHHKFVVVDFNTANGKVYFGSSNLALGGEQQNADNLICIQDPAITTVFAIEALRLVDHFHFRALKLTQTDPIKLRTTNVWAKAYFDKNDIKCLERKLFAGD